MKDKLWNLLLTIAMLAVGYVLKDSLSELKAMRYEVNSVSQRVIAIESSRLTTADGLSIQRQLSDIREAVARIEERTSRKQP